VKIGVDCSSVLHEKTGVGNYVHNLLLNLAKIDTINNYMLFFQSLRHLDNEKITCYAFTHKKIVAIRAPKPLLDFFWYKLKFPSIELLTGKVDIFHSNFYPPLIKKGKSIVTIYDMSFFAYSALQTKAVQGFRNKVLESYHRASKIITISNFSKTEILKFLDIPEEKIEVIYPGVTVNEPKYSNSDEEKLLSKYQLSGSYILFVGTIEPRKNIDVLLKAFEILLQKHKDRYELVIVGRLGWKYEEFLRKLRSSRAQSRIRMLGYVPDNDLPFIYKHASLFVYPSIYEGFGLPVLEAMANEVPVITSNLSSLPEVAGDAALLVNPHDEEQIAEMIDKVLSDSELRRQLIKRGRERVKKFSWMETAKQTLKLYEEVYNEK
jgi:glycosyltransferase involved in cell wall biosynthesis